MEKEKDKNRKPVCKPLVGRAICEQLKDIVKAWDEAEGEDRLKERGEEKVWSVFVPGGAIQTVSRTVTNWIGT